jgi:hypothetical protein
LDAGACAGIVKRQPFVRVGHSLSKASWQAGRMKKMFHAKKCNR